jgi:hypothetical protein
VGLATGENFPDALCAGPLLGAKNTVLLLTTTASLSSDPAAALGTHKARIDEYHLFGGLPALSQNVRNQVAAILRRTTSEPPPPAGGSHALPALFCAGSGCHDTDLASIHIAKGCAMCHGPGVTPTNNCQTCHPNAHAGTHPAIVSAPGAPLTCTVGGGCHGSDALTIHPTCETCHNPTTVITGKTTCQSCHGNFHSEVLPAAHTVAGFCFGSTCHGTDVVRMHAVDFRGSGETPPGCAACHAPGVTPSTDCSRCHFDITVRHNEGAAHAAWQANLAATGSAICTTCHGSNIAAVGSRSVAGGDVHVPAVPTDPVQEHVGCTCHAYVEVAGATQCTSCHAPHGFSQAVVPWDPTGSWVPAGGHNTPLFDVNGGSTRFDGLEGSVLIKDAAGASIVATYPLPTQNVFWSADATDAPAGAKTGLDWTSVVTCYDCHTELEDVAGPQGAALLNAGLDPAFPAEYENAALWAWQAPAVDGTHVSAYPTAGNVFAKSGIVQYVPGGPETTKPSAYAMKTYLTGFALGETTVTVPGPASIERPDSVICSKCHDLHNPGTGHNATGNGTTGDGYAHYHGHDYHDDPVQYAGLFKRASDDTTYTAFMKEADADVQVIGASAGRGAAGHCRNCHVAIPHGWKRPRLLVYETDPAPYNIGPSVTYAGAAAENRYYNFATYGTAHPEGGQLKGISSTLGPVMSHEGEVGEYVNWQNDGKVTCQACGHHYAAPTPDSMWK